MNETNNNFEALKQLLKLKRHEVPPPGYFNNFSGEVISRLRAGEARRSPSLIERLQDNSPWLAGVLRIFETKPGVIGGFATSLCLVLLIGVVLADRPDSAPVEATVTPLADSSQAAPAAPTLTDLAAVTAADNSGITVSTNPVISLRPVANLQNPLFQSASFMTAAQ